MQHQQTTRTHTFRLWIVPNAIITPHIAWSPSEAQLRVVDVAMANVKAWINGHPESSII